MLCTTRHEQPHKKNRGLKAPVVAGVEVVCVPRCKIESNKCAHIISGHTEKKNRTRYSKVLIPQLHHSGKKYPRGLGLNLSDGEVANQQTTAFGPSDRGEARVFFCPFPFDTFGHTLCLLFCAAFALFYARVLHSSSSQQGLHPKLTSAGEAPHHDLSGGHYFPGPGHPVCHSAHSQ